MIIVLIILAFISGAAFEKWNQYIWEDSCPRHELGYNCKGKNCDHSDAAWREVYKRY